MIPMTNKYLEKIASTRAVKEALKNTSLSGGALSSAKGAIRKAVSPLGRGQGDVLSNTKYREKVRKLLMSNKNIDPKGQVALAVRGSTKPVRKRLPE